MMEMVSELDVFVQVDAKKHAQNAQQTDLEAESQRELEKNKVDCQWRADSRCEVGGKHILNRTLRGHDSENFSEDTAEQPADQQEYQQQPGRFSHVDGLLNC